MWGNTSGHAGILYQQWGEVQYLFPSPVVMCPLLLSWETTIGGITFITSYIQSIALWTRQRLSTAVAFKVFPWFGSVALAAALVFYHGFAPFKVHINLDFNLDTQG
ncbi:MAG: hypothetical protein AUK25_10805 [Desulfobacteraceae bacterium CG2_30_51_40]|nr:MAG: hypothetical protein AUK25_10805 [Desulfobacteraceae bacterium CG2_30_51_40]